MAATAVVGVGMTRFAKQEERSLVGLGAEAVRAALADAGIRPGEVEIAFVGNVFAGRLLGDMTVGQDVLWEVGVHRVPVVNVENACASGSTAFFLARNAVASGQAEVALAVGVEKLCVPDVGLLTQGDHELETQLGFVVPASFALRARRHMTEFGTTVEQLAQVSVKNRRHAALNPLAGFGRDVTVAEVLASPMIADPLTRLQCCPNADGAAAALVGSPAVARRLGRAVDVDAAVLCSGSYENPQDLVRWETDYRACRLAFDEAGIGPGDLDLAECHDAFTISELLHYEAMGLCEPGEGGRLVAGGHTALGGRIPVNVSGGLLGRGHPLGATALAQLCELVTQLRGEAGARQVEGARVGLAQCMGGEKAADARSCTAVILSV